MRIGIFVDTSNLYYCVNKKYPNRKLDYGRYLSVVTEENYDGLVGAFAYGSQLNDEASGFITCLKKLGYQPNFRSTGDLNRRVNWDVQIAIDIARRIDRLDTIILGSANPDLVPMVNWARERGLTVKVVACGINRELKLAASDWTEIDDSYLEVRKDERVDAEVGGDETESVATTEAAASE